MSNKSAYKKHSLKKQLPSLLSIKLPNYKRFIPLKKPVESKIKIVKKLISKAKVTKFSPRTQFLTKAFTQKIENNFEIHQKTVENLLFEICPTNSKDSIKTNKLIIGQNYENRKWSVGNARFEFSLRTQLIPNSN